MNGKYELKCINVGDDTLTVLDQTKLPNQVEYIQILNTNDGWNVIKEMKVRGAPLIAVVALQALKVEVKAHVKENYFKNVKELKDFIINKSEYLKTSRPTAVNLANDLEGLENLLNTEEDTNLDQVLTIAYQYIQKNLIDYELSSYEIAKNGADLILKKFAHNSSISVLTICNTGKLAMPGVGTALGIIREINNRHKLKTVYIPETRPYNQGSRLTAFEAINDDLPGILISDSMAGMLMRNKKVDCVIVGADRITKLGYTANKIGTYSLAVLAKQHEIPFYVAAPFSTIDLNLNYEKEIVIEERPADEMRKLQNTDIYLTPYEMPVWNPSFDITPPCLIESIITEKGYYEYDKENNKDWKQLSTSETEEYLKEIGLFEKDEEVKISDVADGNLNFVYRLEGKSNIYCVKQALPWVKCVGTSWPLTLKRVLFEAEALKYEQSICPENVPKFNHYNGEIYLLIMEFLNDHLILRKGLMQQIKYDNIGSVLGKFVAKTCYYSSDIYLNPGVIREKIKFWNDNSLCALTEQVIFSDPMFKAPYNRHTSPHLDDKVEKMRNNPEIVNAFFKLRHKFINLKQALIHGDLHSGSVMVDGTGSIKVIDSEFAFYGPIGFDTANVIAHFLMSYMSISNPDYENWILTEVKSFWEEFETEWDALWRVGNCVEDFPGVFATHPEIFERVKNDFMQGLFEDTLGFTAAEIIRRIVGIAHIADFESISDLDIRARRESMALNLAIDILTKPIEFKSIDEVLAKAKEIKNSK